jgi:hypothetical protein
MKLLIVDTDVISHPNRILVVTGGFTRNEHNKCNEYKAKKREKREETPQMHRHAPVHVSECTHAKDATED